MVVRAYTWQIQCMNGGNKLNTPGTRVVQASVPIASTADFRHMKLPRFTLEVMAAWATPCSINLDLGPDIQQHLSTRVYSRTQSFPKQAQVNMLQLTPPP